MSDEVWRGVVGYEGLYVVSNLGNVRSLPKRTRHREELEMTKRVGSGGYLYVHLRKNGKSNNRLVHRLVAEAFIDNPYNKPQVNHIDGNKKNNNVNNLEWVTHSENQLHSIRVLGNPKLPKHRISPNRHLTYQQAQQIRADNRPQAVIAMDYGVTQMSISLIKRNITYVVEE